MPLKFVELTNPNNFGGEIWLKAKTKIYFDYELFCQIFSAWILYIVCSAKYEKNSPVNVL